MAHLIVTPVLSGLKSIEYLRPVHTGLFLWCSFVISFCMASTTTQTQFSLPVLNINGTSPASIQDEYNNAMTAIRKAEQMLLNCTCHPRDFQCQTYDRYLKAREEREQMLEHLRSVHDYCEIWYWHAVESR